MSTSSLTDSQVKSFHKNGFIIVKNFCSVADTAKLFKTAVSQSASAFNNKFGFEHTDLSSWFSPENDLFGHLARSKKIVDTVSALMEKEEPVCHVQSKLMEKKPKAGAVWAWHQDYAYWATNDFKSSGQMLSVMVALTPIDKNSGCSRIIRGSHKIPTLKHSFNDEEKSAGVDMEDINSILETMDVVYVEIEAGDAIFFHGNLLHCSGENLSVRSCWSTITCYSSVSNRLSKGIFTSWHTPIETVSDEFSRRYANHLFFGKAASKAILVPDSETDSYNKLKAFS